MPTSDPRGVAPNAFRHLSSALPPTCLHSRRCHCRRWGFWLGQVTNDQGLRHCAACHLLLNHHPEDLLLDDATILHHSFFACHNEKHLLCIVSHEVLSFHVCYTGCSSEMLLGLFLCWAARAERQRVWRCRHQTRHRSTYKATAAPVFQDAACRTQSSRRLNVARYSSIPGARRGRLCHVISHLNLISCALALSLGVRTRREILTVGFEVCPHVGESTPGPGAHSRTPGPGSTFQHKERVIE